MNNLQKECKFCRHIDIRLKTEFFLKGLSRILEMSKDKKVAAAAVTASTSSTSSVVATSTDSSASSTSRSSSAATGMKFLVVCWDGDCNQIAHDSQVP